MATVEFKKYRMLDTHVELEKDGSPTTTLSDSDVITSAISIVDDIITVQSLGSVYSFAVYGHTSIISKGDTSLSIITTDNIGVALNAGPYSSNGWYGNYATITSRTVSNAGGARTVDNDIKELPIRNNIVVYVTPVAFTDGVDTNVGILLSTSPTFEQGADYLRLRYGGTTVSAGYNSSVAATYSRFKLEEIKTVATFNPHSLILGYLAGQKARTLRHKLANTEDITDAQLIDGVLYIRNANAKQLDDILEVT